MYIMYILYCILYHFISHVVVPVIMMQQTSQIGPFYLTWYRPKWYVYLSGMQA